MCLGNLLTEAGYDLGESRPYIHNWPKRFRKVAKLVDAVVLSWPVASRADWIVSVFRSVPLHAETVWLMTLERQLEISKLPLVHEQMVRFRLLMCRLLTR